MVRLVPVCAASANCQSMASASVYVTWWLVASATASQDTDRLLPLWVTSSEDGAAGGSKAAHAAFVHRLGPPALRARTPTR